MKRLVFLAALGGALLMALPAATAAAPLASARAVGTVTWTEWGGDGYGYVFNGVFVAGKQHYQGVVNGTADYGGIRLSTVHVGDVTGECVPSLAGPYAWDVRRDSPGGGYFDCQVRVLGSAQMPLHFVVVGTTPDDPYAVLENFPVTVYDGGPQYQPRYFTGAFAPYGV